MEGTNYLQSQQSLLARLLHWHWCYTPGSALTHTWFLIQREIVRLVCCEMDFQLSQVLISIHTYPNRALQGIFKEQISC